MRWDVDRRWTGGGLAAATEVSKNEQCASNFQPAMRSIQLPEVGDLQFFSTVLDEKWALRRCGTTSIMAPSVLVWCRSTTHSRESAMADLSVEGQGGIGGSGVLLAKQDPQQNLTLSGSPRSLV